MNVPSLVVSSVWVPVDEVLSLTPSNRFVRHLLWTWLIGGATGFSMWWLNSMCRCVVSLAMLWCSSVMLWRCSASEASCVQGGQKNVPCLESRTWVTLVKLFVMIRWTMGRFGLEARTIILLLLEWCLVCLVIRSTSRKVCLVVSKLGPPSRPLVPRTFISDMLLKLNFPATTRALIRTLAPWVLKLETTVPNVCLEAMSLWLSWVMWVLGKSWVTLLLIPLALNFCGSILAILYEGYPVGIGVAQL